MSSSKLTVIYTFTTIETKRATFFNAAQKGLCEMREHEGCLHAILSEDIKNSGNFTMFEVWESDNAWKNFLKSSTVAELSEAVGKCTINWEMQKLYTHDI